MLDANRFAAPETYTPRHLAEKILTSKSYLAPMPGDTLRSVRTGGGLSQEVTT